MAYELWLGMRYEKRMGLPGHYLQRLRKQDIMNPDQYFGISAPEHRSP